MTENELFDLFIDRWGKALGIKLERRGNYVEDPEGRFYDLDMIQWLLSRDWSSEKIKEFHYQKAPIF